MARSSWCSTGRRAMKSGRRRSGSSSSSRARSIRWQSECARADHFERAQRGILRGRRSARAVPRLQDLRPATRLAGVRDFLERIHRVMNAIDAAPLTTIAAVHGVTFGGGFELALACDLIVADKMARFCFPELRLGLIPGFGGIPRLKRDLGNAVGARSAFDRAQHQRHEGASGRAGEPGGGRRRRAARGARDGGAARENSTAKRPSPRSGSSSRYRTKSCGARSIFFAICSRGRRWRRGCANSWRARTRCRICLRRCRLAFARYADLAGRCGKNTST